MIFMPSDSCDPPTLSLGRRVCFLSLRGENSKFLREASDTARSSAEVSGCYEMVLLGSTESTLFRVVRFQAPNSVGVRGSFTESFWLLDSVTQNLAPETTARINALWAEVAALLERPAITLTEEIRGMGVAVRRYLTWLATIAILTEGLQGDPEKKVLVLLDHPENGLHPRLQFEMMRHLELAAGGFKGLEIFVATESPILSAQFKPDERFIIERGEGENLRIRPGTCARGRTPDAHLLTDFGLPSLLGDGARQAWDHYVELRGEMRRVGDRLRPTEYSVLSEEIWNLARVYDFVPPAEPPAGASVADTPTALEAWLREAFATAKYLNNEKKIELAAGGLRVLLDFGIASRMGRQLRDALCVAGWDD